MPMEGNSPRWLLLLLATVQMVTWPVTGFDETVTDVWAQGTVSLQIQLSLPCPIYGWGLPMGLCADHQDEATDVTKAFSFLVFSYISVSTINSHLLMRESALFGSFETRSHYTVHASLNLKACLGLPSAGKTSMYHHCQLKGNTP